MIKIITKEMPFKKNLKAKIKFICNFCHTNSEFLYTQL